MADKKGLVGKAVADKRESTVRTYVCMLSHGTPQKLLLMVLLGGSLDCYTGVNRISVNIIERFHLVDEERPREENDASTLVGKRSQDIL